MNQPDETKRYEPDEAPEPESVTDRKSKETADRVNYASAGSAPARAEPVDTVETDAHEPVSGEAIASETISSETTADQEFPGEAPVAPARRRRTLDLESHSIEQNIWILAGPLLAERILQSIVGAADMAMVGRIGAASVAAVGLSNQISLIAMSFFDAIRVGTTAVVARRIGAGELDEAQAALRQSLLIASALGTTAFFLLALFGGLGLSLMGAESDVIAQGIPYFRWRGLSLLFEFISMTFAASLRGSGNTRLPMYSGIVVNLLNVAGNYVLIEGRYGFPRMEAEGAGAATAFARFAGMMMTILLVSTRPNVLNGWHKGSFRPDRDLLGSVFTVGLPASGERLTLRGAQLLYVRAIAGLGTNAYAAHQIALRIESLSLTIGFSFGATATTLVGQYLGYGDPAKAEEAALKARKVVVIAMGCAGVLLFLAAPQVSRLFIPDNLEVIVMCSAVLRIVAVAQPFMGVNHVMAGSLRGAGDTTWTMFITAGSAWAVRVVLTYLFVIQMNLGLPGAWYAMVADLVMRSLLFTWRFRAGHWKEIKV